MPPPCPSDPKEVHEYYERVMAEHDTLMRWAPLMLVALLVALACRC